MSPRALFARLPIRALPSRTFVRHNTNATTARAARVIEMAAQAQVQQPAALEAAVPAIWVASGVLGYLAWTRMEESRDAGLVEKLIVV